MSCSQDRILRRGACPAPQYRSKGTGTADSRPVLTGNLLAWLGYHTGYLLSIPFSKKAKLFANRLAAGQRKPGRGQQTPPCPYTYPRPLPNPYHRPGLCPFAAVTTPPFPNSVHGLRSLLTRGGHLHSVNRAQGGKPGVLTHLTLISLLSIMS